MLLSAISMGVAKRISGHNVVYYSLEMSDYQVGERIDRMLVPGEAPEKEKLVDMRFDSVEGYMAEVKKAHTGCLERGKDIVIKRYPDGEATVNQLRGHFQRLQENGFQPDVVIVDYADNCKLPPGERRDLQLDEVFRQLRAFAVAEDVALVSATQRNATGSRESGTALHQVGGSFMKNGIVDGMYFIDQTEMEKEDHTGRLVPMAVREPAMPLKEILMTLEFRLGIIKTDGFKNTKKARENKDKVSRNEKKQEKMLKVIKENQAKKNKTKREAPSLLELVQEEE